jgi:hypothetical protein
VGTNNNRQSLNPGSTEVNQDDVSRRKGILIDNVTARAVNDITAPSCLPASGPLRITPTDHFISTPRGNRTGK